MNAKLAGFLVVVCLASSHVASAATGRVLTASASASSSATAKDGATASSYANAVARGDVKAITSAIAEANRRGDAVAAATALADAARKDPSNFSCRNRLLNRTPLVEETHSSIFRRGDSSSDILRNRRHHKGECGKERNYLQSGEEKWQQL